MRRVAFAFVCSLLSGPVLGATGDVLTVLGDQVNVRAGPGTESGGIHDSLVATPHRETLVPPAAPDSTPDQATMAPGAAAGLAMDAAATAQPSEDLSDASIGTPESLQTAAAPPRDSEALAAGAGEIRAVDLQRFRDSVAWGRSVQRGRAARRRRRSGRCDRCLGDHSARCAAQLCQRAA